MKTYLTFALGIATCVLVSSCQEKGNATTPPQTTEEIAFTSPVPNVAINYEELVINPSKDTVIHRHTGTLLEIPKNAFLNSKGEAITTPVKINFREFSNPLEIYLGGIPMDYVNEKGEKMAFESAGMFEITVSNKEEDIQVNPNNKIKVTMNSYQSQNNFNNYDYDSTKKQWTVTGQNTFSKTSKETEIEALPKAPEPPRMATAYSFQIADVFHDENTLADYENVWFEPVVRREKDQIGFDSKDIKVKDLDNGTYEIEFIPWLKLHDSIPTKVVCYLAFKDKASYNKALKRYQKRYATRIKIAREKRIQLERDWENYYRKKKEYDLFIAKNAVKKAKGADKIIRTLEVNQFGFVNCDLPINYPQGAKMKVSFTNEVNEPLVLKNVVLVELGTNALFRYQETIQYNPNKSNYLWGITPEGKFAYFTSEDFKQLNHKKKKATLKMHVHPEELNTYDEIMKVLFNN